MPVRREALQGRIEREPGTAVKYLDAAVLDRSASMRELARFHRTKLGKSNVADLYRDATSHGYKVEIALIGLAETGSPGDLHFIAPFVHDKRVAIRAAAVRSLASLGGEDAAADLIAGLQDSSRKVTSSAKKGLENRLDKVEPAVLLGIALNDSNKHVQSAVLYLLARMPTWTAMPYLIQMAIHRNEVLAAQAKAIIEHRYNRVFTNPSPIESLAIRQAIDESRSALPQTFVSGLESWLRYRQRKSP
jgi:HEAT repeat protein